MEGKILVTGGSGFIGTNLLLALRKQKADVLNISLGKPKVNVPSKNIEFGDISEDDLKDVRYIVHLAAVSSPARAKGREDETIRTNVKQLENLLEAASAQGNIRKFVFMSSTVVYKGNGTFREDAELEKSEGNEVYKKSKLMGEEIVQRYSSKLPVITFRVGNAYGPYQQWKENATLVPQMFSQAIGEKKIQVMNGKAVRDFIYIDDICDAICRSLESDCTGIFNLGTGRGASARELAEKIGSMTHAEVEYSGKDEENYKVLDISKIKKELNWKPKFTLQRGLEETYDYYKKEIR